jgi:3'-phosphoadenosine 5'-phosphosulfate (PAPS) 3'-phosphatase
MQKELDAACELAVSAGQLLLEHYVPRPEVEWKGSGDPVTLADRLASEFLIRGFSLICEGSAHLYLDMSGRTSLWDTCAPAALLHEAGGRMTDLKGIPLRYNGPGLRHLDGVIASNGTIHDRVVKATSYV